MGYYHRSLSPTHFFGYVLQSFTFRFLQRPPIPSELGSLRLSCFYYLEKSVRTVIICNFVFACGNACKIEPGAIAKKGRWGIAVSSASCHHVDSGCHSAIEAESWRI